MDATGFLEFAKQHKVTQILNFLSLTESIMLLCEPSPVHVVKPGSGSITVLVRLSPAKTGRLTM